MLRAGGRCSTGRRHHRGAPPACPASAWSGSPAVADPRPWLLSLGLLFGAAASSQSGLPDHRSESGRRLHVVTSIDDAGPGTLREALQAAMSSDGPDLIRFDAGSGPFATPQTIRLASPLPVVTSTVEVDGTIEDRLWEATGVTLSGDGRQRVFEVSATGDLTLRSVTLAGGVADSGGAVASDGRLVLTGVTATGNRAAQDGGAVTVRAGTAFIVNSTLTGNQAGSRGGGLAVLGGSATAVHATIAANAAAEGGAVFNAARLRLANSILADNRAPEDCASLSPFEVASTHNLMERARGCGTPSSAADPALGRLGSYNGPTPTIPLEGGSPAINVASNAAALDEDGRTLQWDQRGNGDPRVVAGIADLGAFEVQYLPDLKVDTEVDEDLRGCSPFPRDCSLRGAIALANADPRLDTIRFAPGAAAGPREIRLLAPLPVVEADLNILADGASVRLVLDDSDTLPLAPGVRLRCEANIVRSAP